MVWVITGLLVMYLIFIEDLKEVLQSLRFQ
jgi:hypothetical protein